MMELACPDIAVVAARGSDQNAAQGEYFGPQAYGQRSHSNGYEGPNFTAFFQEVERRHPGTMDRVHVIGLDEQAYPAAMDLPPLAQEGEKLTFKQTVARLAEVLRTHTLPALAHSVVFGFADSVRAGMANAPGVVAEYERESGCRPRYIVAGYSQGALIGMSLERDFERGEVGERLYGSFYIGSPLRWSAAPRQLHYCLEGDFVCRFTPANAVDALETKAREHASYFVEPRESDQFYVDSFARWVQDATLGEGL